MLVAMYNSWGRNEYAYFYGALLSIATVLLVVFYFLRGRWYAIDIKHHGEAYAKEHVRDISALFGSLMAVLMFLTVNIFEAAGIASSIDAILLTAVGLVATTGYALTATLYYSYKHWRARKALGSKLLASWVLLGLDLILFIIAIFNIPIT